jgi:amino acid adenylation domain-containing protein
MNPTSSEANAGSSVGNPSGLHQVAFVHDLVEQRAAENPNALAIASRSQELSYGELDAQANRLANYLQTLGVKREVVVGIYLDRSPAMAVAALAVVKAGAAYLPLDPIQPVDRLASMMRDSQASVVISRTGMMTGFPSGGWRTVTVDGDSDEIEKQPKTRATRDTKPDDLAYIIYTSGSTGQPKGVELIHSGLSNLVRWHHRAFQVTAADRASAQATLGFDAAVWELWAYLTIGASLHLPEDSLRNDANGLRDWMVSRKITISFAATAMAERLMRLEWPSEGSMRYLLTGADTLRTYPSARLPFVLVNNYGPTECTVVTTSGVVPAGSTASEAPSIGRVIDGAELYILDENRQKVTGDAAGEIYIGGLGLARGYRNRPELTAERFIVNPFCAGERLYRTGDLGRWLPDGEIAFLGRVDEQVKVRGFRIEPTEVAMVLGQHPAVDSCQVAPTEDVHGDRQLTAYLVLAADAGVSAGTLRAYLRQRVPEYMIPASFVSIESVPVTEQGKVDRTALSHIKGTRLSDEAYVAPRTLVEEELSKILQGLLKLDRIGVNDNFFLLGGHSLLGTQVIARVDETFGVDLTLLKLFDNPTVAEMSAEIENLILAKVEESSRADADGETKSRV